MNDLRVMFAKLCGENYFTWKYKMEMYLRKEKVWLAISTERPTVPVPSEGVTTAMITAAETQAGVYDEKDDLARALIGLCVEGSQLAHIQETH